MDDVRIAIAAPPDDAACRDCGCKPKSQQWTRLISFFDFQENTYKYSLCEPCDRIIRDQAYATTGNITTNLWTARLLDWLHSPERKIAESNLHEQGLYCDPVSPDPLLISMEVLKTYTKVFELEVWFRGLQALMKNSGSLSLETPEVKALFMGTGGRALMTFSNQANDSITLITDESRETPCMGIQGIDSTEEIAKALILNVIIAWKDGVRPSSDHDVSIG